MGPVRLCYIQSLHGEEWGNYKNYCTMFHTGWPQDSMLKKAFTFLNPRATHSSGLIF